MVDTHTHLYLPDFADDRAGEAPVERALAAGVDHMIFPNVDYASIEPMYKLAAKYPGKISIAMGLHPTEVTTDWNDWPGWAVMKKRQGSYIAIGETGIDLYWDKSLVEDQMLAFDFQVKLAVAANLPLIIHCRDGLDETLEVLKGHPQAKAVFHSFGGTVDDVKRIKEVGDFYFGINGIVTFKNCNVKESLQEIGMDRLLLETDSPFLAPVPYRGKRNESAYMVNTAKFIADYLGMDIDTLDAKTTANAKALFKYDAE